MTVGKTVKMRNVQKSTVGILDGKRTPKKPRYRLEVTPKRI
jgi:hypothetical protein